MQLPSSAGRAGLAVDALCVQAMHLNMLQKHLYDEGHWGGLGQDADVHSKMQCAWLILVLFQVVNR